MVLINKDKENTSWRIWLWHATHGWISGNFSSNEQLVRFYCEDLNNRGYEAYIEENEKTTHLHLVWDKNKEKG